MGKRKNLVHEKLKKAKPNDMISFQMRLPAYLLSDVKTYGDTTKVIRTALELTRKEKFKHGLLEIIAEVKRQIELLELWEKYGNATGNGLDEDHLLLLNIYRDMYYRIRESEFLRRRRKSK